MNNIIKAETALGLLTAIGLFSLLIMGYLKWNTYQQQQFNLVFQKQQALQIADNQIARQMANLACERRVEQNGIRFEISRCSHQEIMVHFPMGQVEIKKGS